MLDRKTLSLLYVVYSNKINVYLRKKHRVAISLPLTILYFGQRSDE